MAEKAFKKLNEQLNCAICLETYTDPKQLQCFHIYCTKCLIKLVVRDQQGQLSLTCPTCRQLTPIASNGVTGLQSAFQINEFLEIRDDLKQAKDPVSTQERVETQGDSTSQTPSKMVIHYCSEHAEEELKLYCETCNKLICYKCGLRGGKHHSHDYDPLDKAFDKYKGEITSSLEPMEKQLETIHTALAQLDTCSSEISDQQVTIETSINDTIKQFHEILDVRKTELIDQLHHIIQGKLKVIATRRDQVETIQAQLRSSLEFINVSLKTDNLGEVLKMKTTIVKQAEELTTPFQPDTLKPNTEADVTFSAPPDITAVCTKYGQIISPGSPDPSNCYVTGEGLKIAVVGEKSSSILQAINYNGKPYEKPIRSLQCELMSEITHATVRGSLEKREKSQYEISYQPTIKGKHQLHIKMEGQHIRGSPFTIVVELPVAKFGTSILTIDEVKAPWKITFNRKEEVVVTEWGTHCVSVFNPSGEKLQSFGTFGSGQGQFICPCGVTVDGEGNILVADNDNHRIQQFTAQGQFITSVGTNGNGPLQFCYPHGITFNASNNKVYVVDQNHCVQVLNSDLSFLSSFGRSGNGKGHFNDPHDISCDSTGKVYVADTNNHRIQVFRAKGKFLRMFGRHGDGRGELYYPTCITIDTSNRVYVGDLNDRISVFSSDGQFLTSFGRRGERPGEFSAPRGLAVDASGVLYVCDGDNYRIQVF